MSGAASWLGGYITAICALALLSACADMLLPKGGLRDSVRFALGLIFILALLRPVVALFRG